MYYFIQTFHYFCEHKTLGNPFHASEKFVHMIKGMFHKKIWKNHKSEFNLLYFSLYCFSLYCRFWYKTCGYIKLHFKKYLKIKITAFGLWGLNKEVVAALWHSIHLICTDRSANYLQIQNKNTFCSKSLGIEETTDLIFISGYLVCKQPVDVCVPHGTLLILDVSPCCPPLSPRYQGGVGCHEYPQSPCHPACHHRRVNVTSRSKLWLRHHMLGF